MIKNYLTIAFRNLKKYRFISFINLFGLTIGLTCCLLIFIFIRHELSYDKYQPNADRVYRVTRTFKNTETGAVSLHLGSIAPAIAPLLQNDFKEIESMTRLLQNNLTSIRYNDKMLNQEDVYFADNKFFDFFKVDLLKGNPNNALNDPFSVMLTEEAAKKCFGDEDPINKTLRINFGDYRDFKVTGIYKALPSNTHFHPEMMLSFATLNDTAVYGADRLKTSWSNNSFLTYIRLPENYDPKKLEAQFPSFLNRHLDVYDGIKPTQWTSLFLQKLTDIHLRSHTDYEAEENGDIKRVYVFSAIALFILLIACINYMNLSTARSTLRAREIGIRKTVGAQRKEIIAQFLSESVLITWIAMILAFGFTWLLIPWLNDVSGTELSIGGIMKWYIIAPVLLVPFVVGILSGIYPALFISSFQPVKVLKGLVKTGGINISFRQILVTLQFAISIILIICTAIVFSQMRYMQNKALGFDKDQIISLPYVTALNDSYNAFRIELLSNAAVKNIGRSSRIPTGRLLDAQGASLKRGDTLAPVSADIKNVYADEDFISTYGVKLVAGRDFSREFGSDTSAFLINEASVSALGLKRNEDAIGKDFGYGERKGKIIGVINDFHFESMHQKIVPLVLFVAKSQNNYGRISIKVAGANSTAALAHIEKTWRTFLPSTPYEYSFLDENFAQLYKAEERQRTLFTTFAFIAIFIACLGLFGLSAFAISQRIKEIGIRKVLGANVTTIVALLSKDFLKLVGFSALIAFPVAWFAMNKWLQDFAYRVDMPWWIFIVAGIIAAVIALLTISFQAIKAAVANPVKSLRTE